MALHCQSALQMCGTVLCDIIQVNQDILMHAGIGRNVSCAGVALHNTYI